MKTVELLEKLTSLHGVSGCEEEVVSFLKDFLEPIGAVSTDSMNNVYCTFGEGYHILLNAHTDEIGLVVTEITNDGFLKVAKCGGVDPRMLLGYEVTVHGKKDIFGIISTLPPHLQKAEDSEKVPDFSAISIDVGMNFEDVCKIVSLGDKITFKRNFTPLLNNCLSASCLDDRAGVAVIVSAAQRIKKLNLPCKITLMLCSQEEVGTRGSKIGPYGLNACEAISVDVSFAYTPQSKKEECGIISNGPMIGVSPILDREMSDCLIKCAEKNGIKYQLEVMPGNTGTDADSISVCESGIKTALISLPQKYMHTPVETVSIDDIEAASDLICAYACERAGENNA